MSIRQIVVLFLLLAVFSVALPSVADAGVVRDAPTSAEGRFEAPGLVALLSAWFHDLLLAIELPFVATEGATITSGG